MVCLDKRLVVEIDGLIHQLPENKESDELRTKTLNKLGFKVLRITNEQVTNETEKTLELIATALNSQLSIKDKNNLSSPFGGQGADYHRCFCSNYSWSKKTC